MSRARSFFYVSLGVLALALAYHFGASTSTAQGAIGPVSHVIISSGVVANPDLLFLSNGTVLAGYHDSFGTGFSWGPWGTIPSSTPIVAAKELGSNAGGRYTVAYAANGDCFRSIDYGRTWTLAANALGGATMTTQESFGQLKARYRGERAAVPQGATQPQRVDKR